MTTALAVIESTDVVDHTTRAHAVLSASGCKRWWNCPGSVRASEGIPNTSSKWSLLGTAAHEVANVCLNGLQPASDFIGIEFKVEDEVIIITADMAEAVQVYLDVCAEYMGDGWEYYVERKFSLEKLNPPVPMFGTSDFTALHRKDLRLVVVDYKNGAGVDVSITGNPQLRYYALGALLAFDEMPTVKEVEIIIVQPNTPGQDVKREIFHIADLFEWSFELMERAAATQLPDAPLAAGDWCTFCPREGRCVAQARKAMEAAQIEFESLCEWAPGTKLHLPDTSMITPEQFGVLLPALNILDGWMTAARSAAHKLADRGITIPNHKMVPTRATERWVDKADAPAELAAIGIAEKSIYQPREVVSPAQARNSIADHLKAQFEAGPPVPDAKGKLKKPKMTKEAAQEKARAMLTGLTEKISSGTKLVEDADSSALAITHTVHTDFVGEDLPVTIEGEVFELDIY